MATSSKIVLVRQLVEAARNNLDTATQLLKDLGAPEVEHKLVTKQGAGSVQRTEAGAVIIEGVFDGQNMVGPDGKLYSVPANYASKSKLVEGDLLKLTISPDGSFIYKQIGPVERDRVVGVLARDEQTDEFRVLARSHFFRVLLASVTYFKAGMGDEVVVLVPKGSPSTWAAVENVIKKEGGSSDSPVVSVVPAEGVAAPDTAPVAAPRPRGRPRKTAVPSPVEPAADMPPLEPDQLEI
ncbi:MAG: hypothetical protein U1C53_03000 [Candidatus Veblenbacteria bacterium]|nr:hypothetical protein [Candidatus Veblenbacteria bacterium]MDZ4230082.1 hypothetical protein [Candidatus Veblenbacteria bacterium]